MSLQFLLISIPVILVTITIHEYAHAKVADMLGDPTPRLAGRLTLNPISHIDPIGLLMLILVRFGWAKPVPINPYNFSDPRTGSLYVGLAGPVSNLFVAWLLATIFRFANLSGLDPSVQYFVSGVASFAIWINIALAVFNLIPVPPLDGSHILEAVLPEEGAEAVRGIAPYGFFILMFILFFTPARLLLVSVIQFIYNVLTL